MPLKYVSNRFSEIGSLPLDRWHILEREELLQLPILQIPLTRSMKIVADIEYDGPIKFRKSPYTPFLVGVDERMQRENVTYPESNPLFTELNQTHGRPNYRFEADYRMKASLRTLEEAADSTPAEIRKTHYKDVKEGVKTLVDRLIKGIKDENRRFIHDDLCGPVELLLKIHQKAFLACYRSNLPPDLRIENFDELFDRYSSSGEIPYNAYSISTFVTGLANAAGLSARRLFGEMVINIPGTSRADTHIWNEVYLPSPGGKGFWFFMDPLFGFDEFRHGELALDEPHHFGAYPWANSGFQYVANCPLPLFLGEDVDKPRIKMSIESPSLEDVFMDLTQKGVKIVVARKEKQ